ncbi:MAG: lipoprotein insertase outer membrane protein LolB [Glaciecola sp.]|nr:lipoprotein insertase outer membrane protein LolB [Glaciecola sp.]MDG2100288.1 lipoprotein insertase outer membrane protein LolB [Glaciecola sp.]
MYPVPHRFFGLFKFALISLVLLGLNGCTSLQSNGKPSANLIKAQNIQALTQWQANGKIAIISENKRQSANFNWLQHNDDYKTYFNTFLGINVLTVKRDTEGLVIVVEGNTYQGDNPEQLVFDLTGWWLPMDQLSDWLKADVSAEEGIIIRNAQGQIDQFIPHCSQTQCTTDYLINYAAYRQVEQLQLPHSVTLQANGLTQQTLKIKIQQWR